MYVIEFESGLKKIDFSRRTFRAEILKIFGWHFGRNDDLINSF